MSRLSYNRVNNIKSRYLIFWFTLMKKEEWERKQMRRLKFSTDKCHQKSIKTQTHCSRWGDEHAEVDHSTPCLWNGIWKNLLWLLYIFSSTANHLSFKIALCNWLEQQKTKGVEIYKFNDFLIQAVNSRKKSSGKKVLPTSLRLHPKNTQQRDLYTNERRNQTANYNILNTVSLKF